MLHLVSPNPYSLKPNFQPPQLMKSDCHMNCGKNPCYVIAEQKEAIQKKTGDRLET